MLALNGGAVVSGVWGRRSWRCPSTPTPRGRAWDPWLRGSLGSHPSSAVRRPSVCGLGCLTSASLPRLLLLSTRAPSSICTSDNRCPADIIHYVGCFAPHPHHELDTIPQGAMIVNVDSFESALDYCYPSTSMRTKCEIDWPPQHSRLAPPDHTQALVV